MKEHCPFIFSSKEVTVPSEVREMVPSYAKTNEYCVSLSLATYHTCKPMLTLLLTHCLLLWPCSTILPLSVHTWLFLCSIFDLALRRCSSLQHTAFYLITSNLCHVELPDTTVYKRIHSYISLLYHFCKV